MFDVLAYLYETYHRPDAFPEAAVLAKTLSDVGFEETEIVDALDWLNDLAESTETFTSAAIPVGGMSFAQRIYAAQEHASLGTRAVGFIQSLETAGILDPTQREIVIERAAATGVSPMPVDKLRLIVLMILWSQGEDPDTTMLNPVFADPGDRDEFLFH